MNQFDFYKELYDTENKRRNEVQDSLNIPILLITTISTVTFYFITQYDYKIQVFLFCGVSLNCLFIILNIITSLLIIISIFWLTRAFVQFSDELSYSGIPYPKKLFNWHKELQAFYNKQGKTNNEADVHFENYLVEDFVKHIDHNMFANDKKLKFIFNCKRFLLFSVISIFCTLIPFGINHFKKQDTIYQVKVLPTPIPMNPK